METDSNPPSGRKRHFRFFAGMRGGASEEQSTEQEIISMVEEGHEKGELQESEAQMIHNIFAFDEKEARDIMTHRKNIDAVDGALSLEEVLEYVQDKEYSRFPVYMETIDNITGVIHIKDLLRLTIRNVNMDQPVSTIPGVVRKIPFIPETRHIDTLFRNMQAKKTHMAIVIDEYGQTAGLITIEDILEEIVGDILDEYDKEEEQIIPQRDGSFIMSGEADMDEVCKTLEIHDEELEDFDTLNGFLVSKIDKIPAEGENYSISAYGYSFQVMQVLDKMIGSVRVRRLPDKSGEDTEILSGDRNL